MNLSFLKLHRSLLLSLVVMLASVLTLTLSYGQYKGHSEVDWFDVAGEGGITAMTLLWIFFILLSRPKGRVTNLLFAGLAIMNLSMTLDFIDEFVSYSDEQAWLSTIESIPAPFGMILMTIALYHWHQEQMNINQQLRNRERFYREHQLSDAISGLASADYMKSQINRELNLLHHNLHGFSLLMFDIAQFDRFNRQYGDAEGDNLLQEFAQVITLNVREQDLVCRYASDCFIVMLPNTKLAIAEQLSLSIVAALEAFSFNNSDNTLTHNQKVHTSLVTATTADSTSGLLSKLHQELLKNKHINEYSHEQTA